MKTALSLAAITLAGTAIGFSIPISEDGDTLITSLGKQPEQPDLLALSQPQAASSVQWGQEVALPRAADGHFYADVSIDGFPTRMLVDTGATVIALTGDDAYALGLHWDDSDLAPVAQGAGGPVMGVNVRLPRVAVGGFEAENVGAIIVPEGLHVSLLGQSFLSTIDNVRIAEGRMLLGN